MSTRDEQHAQQSAGGAAGEAVRPEVSGCCSEKNEGSMPSMMVEHTCSSSGVSSLSGPKIDHSGPVVSDDVHRT